MDLGRPRVYFYRLRSILHLRWADYLLLTLVIAVVGGLAMGTLVLGRRTQSAYASFLGRDDASTLSMSTYGNNANSSANFYSPSIAQRMRRLPEVAQVETWVGTYNAPLEKDGTPDFAVLNSVNIAGSLDGVFFNEDRVTVLDGRMANPADPYEFMTSRLGAALLGMHVGQTRDFGTYGQASVRLPMRLVAIVEFDNAVIQDDTDRIPTNLVLTPALARTEENEGNGTWYAVRLRPGVKDIGSVEQRLTQLLPPGSVANFSLTSTTEAKVESAVRPESIAVGSFGLIAALAALGISLPILARTLVDTDEERRVLRALGADRATVAADFYAGVAASVVLGTLLACVVSAVLGGLGPLGPVRTVYHPHDFVPDWTITAAGAAALLVVLGGAAVVMIVRRSNPGRADARRRGQTSVSRAVDAAASVGLPAPALVGARFALEPGRGHTSVPARSVLAGAVLSVTLVVTTLTFASGLRTLVGHPALYGWDWGYTISGNYGVAPDALAALRRDPAIQSWTGYAALSAPIDSHSVPVLITKSTPTVAPPLLTGHLPGAGEIVLGQETLAALHKRVGETVQVGFGSPSTAPLYLPPRPLKIVGVATFPALAGSSTFSDHTSMGTGALFSDLSLPATFLLQTKSPDPVQDGPPLVLVKFRPSVSRSAEVADLARIVALANRQFATDPMANQAVDTYIPVQRPAPIVNYQSTGSVPLLLASGLAVSAVIALAFSLVASVRRRQRDLAVLKTLGFVRRQVVATVATQALVTAVVACAMGIPVGIAAGRQLWVAFARSIYVVPRPTVPGSVALVALGALVVAVTVALVPGRLAARTPAASVLRAD